MGLQRVNWTEWDILRQMNVSASHLSGFISLVTNQGLSKGWCILWSHGETHQEGEKEREVLETSYWIYKGIQMEAVGHSTEGVTSHNIWLADWWTFLWTSSEAEEASVSRSYVDQQLLLRSCERSQCICIGNNNWINCFIVNSVLRPES